MRQVRNSSRARTPLPQFAIAVSVSARTPRDLDGVDGAAAEGSRVAGSRATEGSAEGPPPRRPGCDTEPAILSGHHAIRQSRPNNPSARPGHQGHSRAVMMTCLLSRIAGRSCGDAPSPTPSTARPAPTPASPRQSVPVTHITTAPTMKALSRVEPRISEMPSRQLHLPRPDRRVSFEGPSIALQATLPPPPRGHDVRAGEGAGGLCPCQVDGTDATRRKRASIDELYYHLSFRAAAATPMHPSPWGGAG